MVVLASNEDAELVTRHAWRTCRAASKAQPGILPANFPNTHSIPRLRVGEASTVVSETAGRFPPHRPGASGAKRIAEPAAQRRLPAIFDDRVYARAGGFMSYASDLVNDFRRAAGYVDRILRGAKPGDLPVEQPTKFELVINKKKSAA
jgi:hypothetical protein